MKTTTQRTRKVKERTMDNLPSINTLVDPDFVSWYPQGLPTSLANRLEETGFNLTYDAFKPVENYEQKLTLDLAHAEAKHAPAHGHIHASRVMLGGDEALRKLESLLGVTFPTGLMQHVKRGLARHDWRHPGAPYHELVQPQYFPMIPSTLQSHPNDYSVEYVTSAWVDEENEREAPEDLAGRLLETYIIWSSTTRPSNEYSRRLGIDHINPKGFLGCLMAALDVKPTEELTYTLQFELDLFCIEVMPFPLPKTREEYIRSREYFLDFIRTRYNALDRSVRRIAIDVGLSTDFSFTELLGWRKTLSKLSSQIEEMGNGHNESWAVFNSLLMHRNGSPR